MAEEPDRILSFDIIPVILLAVDTLELTVPGAETAPDVPVLFRFVSGHANTLGTRNRLMFGLVVLQETDPSAAR